MSTRKSTIFTSNKSGVKANVNDKIKEETNEIENKEIIIKKKQDVEIPIFPIFDLHFIKLNKKVYLLAGGGGGNPEFGKQHGLILFIPSIKKNTKEPFTEHLFYETEEIVKRICLFTKQKGQYVLLETDSLLHILLLKDENNFKKILTLKNEKIFSFEQNLFLWTEESRIMINYEENPENFIKHKHKSINEKKIVFFNIFHNMYIVDKGENNYEININKKTYKTNNEIKHIYHFGEDLFLVLKEFVLYFNENKELVLQIKFCTKISKHLENYVFASADGHVYIYHIDVKKNFKIFYIKKVYDLAVTAVAFDSVNQLLAFSSYDCTLGFKKTGYQRKFVFMFLLLVLWILGAIFVLRKW
ncbi:hypothetical protein CDIK_3441 [Cucumispora dikerogammari]|nr:hypothetical protein CDIK_3441 [Cucumispora dikerogammari]